MYHSPVLVSSNQDVGVFAALADPTRFALLERLRGEPRRVGELCQETGLAQSLISFHLKALRESGLVRSRKEGRTIWYSIDPAGIARLSRVVERLGATGHGRGESARKADLELCRKYINTR